MEGSDIDVLVIMKGPFDYGDRLASSPARGGAVVNAERAALAQHRFERARPTASRAVLVIDPCCLAWSHYMRLFIAHGKG
ncbi:MAG: hypothetical protein HY704_14650 [Gemmatimonadetes bacterium]|nr:hypothetical protein [Gemmatimonadota bacterium]